MEFKTSGTYNGSNETALLSYQVTSSSGGIYNLNVNYTSSGQSGSATASVDANNDTVLSVSTSGFPVPKAYAKTAFDSFMSAFGLSLTYTDEIGVFTDSAYFHSTGTASMTFGTTSFDVTTWVPNSPPVTVSACGVTTVLTNYELQVGTPPGTSLTFITYLHVVETSPDTADFTWQLVSMTVG
jgi:hypothetical protein